MLFCPWCILLRARMQCKSPTAFTDRYCTGENFSSTENKKGGKPSLSFQNLLMPGGGIKPNCLPAVSYE